MSHDTDPARLPDHLPFTAQTRADGLRVDDRIFVRHDDEDFWALITEIEDAEDPGRLRLELRLESDGVPVGTCTQTATLDTTFLRMLPYRRPVDAIPATTEHGLSAAALLYRSNWDGDGTVSVSLPALVARQILGDRGWEHVRNGDGTHVAWKAPNGDRFWECDEAVRFALTAECADSPPPSALIATQSV